MSERRIRSKTISLKVLNNQLSSEGLPTDHARPKTRGDCIFVPPCKSCEGTGVENGQSFDRFDRENLRGADGSSETGDREEWGVDDPDLASSVHLRSDEDRARRESSYWQDGKLRVQAGKARGLRQSKKSHARVQDLDEHASALSEPKERDVSSLRGARHRGLREVVESRELPTGYGPQAVTKALSRQKKQRSGILSRELPLGDPNNASPEQENKPCSHCGGSGRDFSGVGGDVGALEHDYPRTSSAWMVPRTRNPNSREPRYLTVWNVSRPCVMVGCRYHLYLEVHPQRGSIKLNFPDVGPDELDRLPATCALDIADNGPYTLSEITPLLNVTSRERIRQIVEGAQKKVETDLIELGLAPDEFFRE